MDILENILTIWGIISLIGIIVSFISDTFEYSDDVKIIDGFTDQDINELSFYSQYPLNCNSCEHTLFIAEKNDIKNIILYQYNLGKNRWVKKELIKKHLSINKGIVFHIDRPEGFPINKIKWNSTYGKTSEYVFSFNGFLGNHNEYIFKYHYNLFSKIRKILNIK